MPAGWDSPVTLALAELLISTPTKRKTSKAKKHSRDMLKCARKGCKSDVFRSNGYSSTWCKRHTCGLGPSLCNEKKKSSRGFCNRHEHCDASDCRVLRTTKTPTWCCETHSCQFTSTPGTRECSQQPLPNSIYCAEHGRQSICVWGRCPVERVPGTSFCSNHKCPDCTAGSYPGRDSGRCLMHQICGAIGCSRYCVVGPNGEPGMFCVQHHLCNPPWEYCEKVLLQNTSYCDDHRCGVGGCMRYRDQYQSEDNLWCQDHTCTKGNCMNRVENTSNPHSRCCTEHTCRVTDCYGQVIDHRRLCQQHFCNAAGCSIETPEEDAFCDTHKCRVPGCQGPAKVPEGHCDAHACVIDGCGEPRADAKRHLCVAHTYRAGRDDGFARGQETSRMALRQEMEQQEDVLAQFENALNLEHQQSVGINRRRPAIPRARAPRWHGRERREAEERARMYRYLPDDGFRQPRDWFSDEREL